MNNLIAFTGKAGSGKDTLAHLMPGYYNVSFATPIRRALVAIGVPPKNLTSRSLRDQILPTFGKSAREMMQTLGTEWGRELINPEIWVRLAEKEIRNHRNRGRAVVVTDLRFTNEADMIRRLGGDVVQIIRKAPSNQSYGHQSEHQSVHADYVVQNSSTPEHMLAQLQAFLD